MLVIKVAKLTFSIETFNRCRYFMSLTRYLETFLRKFVEK